MDPSLRSTSGLFHSKSVGRHATKSDPSWKGSSVDGSHVCLGPIQSLPTPTQQYNTSVPCPRLPSAKPSGCCVMEELVTAFARGGQPQLCTGNSCSAVPPKPAAPLPSCPFWKRDNCPPQLMLLGPVSSQSLGPGVQVTGSGGTVRDTEPGSRRVQVTGAGGRVRDTEPVSEGPRST